MSWSRLAVVVALATVPASAFAQSAIVEDAALEKLIRPERTFRALLFARVATAATLGSALMKLGPDETCTMLRREANGVVSRDLDAWRKDAFGIYRETVPVDELVKAAAADTPEASAKMLAPYGEKIQESLDERTGELVHNGAVKMLMPVYSAIAQSTKPASEADLDKPEYAEAAKNCAKALIEEDSVK